MKSLLIILALLSSSILCAQDSEFKEYDNGLIYSSQTMKKLHYIVDSLNLQYKVCNLDKVFYSVSQTVGYMITMDEKIAKRAKADIKNQLSIDAFQKKYPKAVIEKEVLIFKHIYSHSDGNKTIEFNKFNFGSNYGYTISKSENMDLYNGDLKNKWVYDENSYKKAAFYFPNNFTAKPLKEKYARMIGYADCLIDTTTLKFKKETESGWLTNFPENWEELPLAQKQEMLNDMRSTRVVGICSQDDSPRIHAMRIAALSAETTNWEVFLRSHLDIMNDRFDRTTDGSYAYGTRKTYIRELEELDINVIDLIFGISLRVTNPSQNHYHGSIQRVGRALSETQNRAEIEQAMLSMIEDDELDDYNRVLVYYLFLNYNEYISDEKVQNENVEKLMASVDQMPSYIKRKINE